MRFFGFATYIYIKVCIYVYTIEAQRKTQIIRLKYGPKPFILPSVLYPGIYLQAAGQIRFRTRQQEKFEELNR